MCLNLLQKKRKGKTVFSPELMSGPALPLPFSLFPLLLSGPTKRHSPATPAHASPSPARALPLPGGARLLAPSSSSWRAAPLLAGPRPCTAAARWPATRPALREDPRSPLRARAEPVSPPLVFELVSPAESDADPPRRTFRARTPRPELSRPINSTLGRP